LALHIAIKPRLAASQATKQASRAQQIARRMILSWGNMLPPRIGSFAAQSHHDFALKLTERSFI